MTMQVRMWLTALSFVAGLGLVTSASAFVLQDSPEQAIVKKVAGAIKSGDVKKAAKDGAKKFAEVSDLMHMFRPRKKGGMGWGVKEGSNPATDGLEKKIQEFTKAVPPAVVADAANNVAAANWITALAEMTIMHAPPKDAGGGKTKKAWIGFAEDMRAASIDLAKAAEAKKGPDMAKAASKLNSACLNCHSKFKE
jgi:hypothetical protein